MGIKNVITAFGGRSPEKLMMAAVLMVDVFLFIFLCFYSKFISWVRFKW